ncbi:MAG: enoyl-CoA hydratase-related protein [Bdellovibrionaceae bacterium]|nr:enoyl-CoA hydratase-related protein [Pseudobdellovibrionaceae bacterium]
MQHIHIERQSGFVVVSLNRPDVRNAFHPHMIDEITRAFLEDFNRDNKLRGVILRGSGKAFCAGADLGWMKSMVDFTLKENIADSEKLFEMFAAIRACPVPVIGRVHGFAMGGALGLVAVCDIVAAETQAQFCFSEAKLGLAPAVISPFVLEKMAAGYAHRYMLTAETFAAADARASGLVHFVGDEPAIDAFIEDIKKALAGNGPEAVRATKGLLRLDSLKTDERKAKSETTRVIAERRVSAEGQEGLRAFLEKRVPSWKGT